MPDKTTTSEEAKQALGVNPSGGLLQGDNYWVDLLKQTYHTYRNQALDATKPKSKRRNYAMAALAADLLSQYYQHQGMNLEAEAWVVRATRLFRISFNRVNDVVGNIGGSMD